MRWLSSYSARPPSICISIKHHYLCPLVLSLPFGRAGARSRVGAGGHNWTSRQADKRTSGPNVKVASRPSSFPFCRSRFVLSFWDRQRAGGPRGPGDPRARPLLIGSRGLVPPAPSGPLTLVERHHFYLNPGMSLVHTPTSGFHLHGPMRAP